MEMPREEMELVDAAAAFDTAAFDPWSEPEGEDGDETWDDWQIEDISIEPASGGVVLRETASGGVYPRRDDDKPGIRVVAATIKTAATLSREKGHDEDRAAAEPLPRVSPDVFKQGMTVTHPEYGPGKIVALSGVGKNRRATIQFATVGQKKIILAHSAVRPVC
jgi:DNA helicase-2/ATP-dependent DNA helicase PcrA